MQIFFMLAAWLFASAAQAVTLADQLAEAWRLHPEARALDARIEILKAGHAQAASLLAAAPSVAFSYRGDELASDHGQREFEAALDLPLWLPGQRDAARNAIASEWAAVDAARAALRLKLLGELRERNGALRRAQAERELSRIRLTEARALEADVERRFKAGALARTDVLAAQLETLAVTRELTAREGAVELARSQLAAIGGGEQPPPAESLADASTGHPEVSLRRAELAAARDRFRAAQLDRRDAPEVSLFGRRERGDRLSAYEASLGVRLKLPLASDVRNAPRLARAHGEAETAEVRWQYAQRLTEAGIEQAKAALEAARQALSLARQGAAVSAENHRHQRRAFELGERDLATLLRAKALADAARQEVVRAEAEVDLAIARLNQAQGVMP